ncbi:MAG: type II toxin-antitoxin system Phd/YefM family antitoxin [Nitrospirae bacterium]|nr:type II toxin-antitoxin system Phd/YefM family antitoxin [Nitrospirota bacterium]
MSATVNIHEAKTYLSRLLARVGEGEEVIIAKAGKPVARLIPIAKRSRQRMPGSAKNKIVIRKKFFKPLPAAVLDAFEK